MLKRWIIYLLSVVLGVGAVGAILCFFVVMLLYPRLPDLTTITDYQPKIPLRVYSEEGDLLGEFGVERRSVVKIKQVPDLVKAAILAAEDERFYSHGGVDYISMSRAAIATLSGNKQGGGTITMQVAREFFLTREQTYTRKLNEVLLAYKIEANLSKDEILELYINQINLGQRAYGFASAARIYFGKTLEQLTAAEAAMLAGLPKAPSAFNPVVNPQRARQRQQYVLRRMLETRAITDPQYQRAIEEDLAVRTESRDAAAHAEFIAEMARQVVYDAYGDDAYTKGIKVYTTIRTRDQEAAYVALRRGVMDYDRRHGYRGPEALVNLPADPNELDEVAEKVFQAHPDSEDLVAGIVTQAGPRELKVLLHDFETVTVGEPGLKFVARALGDKAAPATRVRVGAVVRLFKDDKGGYSVTQLPQAESAFIALNPANGAIVSLVGGFDFYRNKYNHVTLASRQPGSSFKPFIYSAALEKGFTPATVIADEPLYFDASVTGSEAWAPKNYDGKYEGPMPLKTALARSKNMVSIRILQAIGTQYAQDYATKFGFDPKQHPAYLTMALGAGNATPLQMAAAYSVFANGGFRVTPYLIDRIVDGRGNVLARTEPVVAGEDAEQVIDPRNAFVMTTLLRGVITGGTGSAARSLGRGDLAGKTGTTNDHIDAWFCGFNHARVGIAWIGFDQPRGLGANETGGTSALPIWIGYMSKVLKGVPERPLRAPEGVIAIGTDYYFQEFPPREAAPLPLLPTQMPPSDAPSALPSTSAPVAANAPAPVPAPLAPVVPGTGAMRPTPPPAPPAAQASERSFGTQTSPFQPFDRAQ
ncbi:MAG: penicillin-binding protein 1A [Betaproteobacteria bacterium]|nr:penicillin-binding protein 1A [Betaproteobacteria bacterium]